MTVTTVSPANRAPGAPSPNSAYPVKSNSVQPFGGAGMTTAQIMNILHGLDPGAVAEAGAAYTNLGHELGTMAASLTQHAQTLAQNWTGSAAQAAMTSFQQLHDQTSALASQAAQTGSALTWLGAQVLPKFQQLGGPDAGLSGSGATAAQAQEYIRALSNYLVTANTDLPGQIGGVASPLSPAVPATTNGTSRGGTGGTAGLGAGVAGGLGTVGSGAGGTANSGQASVSDGAASGLGPGSGGGTAPGAGSAGSAAGTGSAGGTSLPGSGAGGNAPGADGTASPASSAPAPTANSLQSATPIPGSTPGLAPVSASPAAPASSAGSAAGDLGAGAAALLPVIPGLSGAGGGRRRAAASEAADPAARTPPGAPGAPGSAGAAAPEAPPLGHGPAAGMAPLPEMAPPDGGLSGGAAPLPQAPALNAPGTGAVGAAVPAGEGAGPSVLLTDGPGAPGGGDSPGREGPGAMPMAGGATGQSEQERTRRVWAYEDQNIWGLPADCVPPVIEGG